MLKKTIRIPSPKELPWAYAKNSDRFPTQKGLYFVKPWWGIMPVVYIGITQDKYGFKGRWRNHQKLGCSIWTASKVYFWELNCPRQTLEDAETIAIQHYSPAWNKAKKIGRAKFTVKKKITWIDLALGFLIGCLLAVAFAG